jgi:hypothetical protein
MDAMLGISLYSYLYLTLAKTLCLSYYCLCLLFNKFGEKARTGSSSERGGGEERERAGSWREKWPNVCTYEKFQKIKNK